MARLAALLPRLAALVIICLLATSTITFAAANKRLSKSEADALPVAGGPKTLIVPDIRRQAHVFAKGILEDGGFAWHVEGAVKGYAANLVAVQFPAPGTRVLDTGSPTIVIRLERNPAYEERGLPENVSPYKGTKLVLVGAKATKDPAKPKAKDKKPAKKNEPAAPGGSGTTRASQTSRFRAHRRSRPTRCRSPTARACSRSASPVRRSPPRRS